MIRQQACLIALIAGTGWMTVARQADGQAPTVHLERWAGEARRVPNRGPGEEFFRLRAEASWSEGAARSPGRLGMRVVLPDGQTQTRSLPPGEPAGARWLTVLVPVASVRNRLPSEVAVRAQVVEAASGQPVSNELTADITQFPRPQGSSPAYQGPFGWGRPLSAGPDGTLTLPRPGPEGFRFVWVPPEGDMPGVAVATTEASVRQVASRLEEYDPREGRSDEFLLDGPSQPAINLTPSQVLAFLDALTQADTSGVVFRLPSRDEWLRAARAGRPSEFWWGDATEYPEGANFLGSEPGLPTDTTAPVGPSPDGPDFAPNPWGLYHTFGNAEEWASVPDADDRFVRLGGHFRTEPEAPLPETPVDDPDSMGPDPYVGVRPALTLTEDLGTRLVNEALRADSRTRDVQARFDPRRAVVTLTGRTADGTARRLADRLAAGPWWVAAVENRITTPTEPPGRLARLGEPAGPVQMTTTLGRRLYQVPLSVRWSDPLPVAGSDWYVNVYLPDGRHEAHRMIEREPRPDRPVMAVVNASRLPSDDATVTVALSLGAPAPRPDDPRIVSNPVRVSVRPSRS